MNVFPCRQVRASERFNWAATRGVNEDMLMENLPEELQREIRRHLLKFAQKVNSINTLSKFSFYDEKSIGCFNKFSSDIHESRQIIAIG